MGMYLKQQQNNTRLHSRLTSQLETRLNQPKTKVAPKARAIASEDPIVSFRGVGFIVLTIGGVIAILLAFLQRQYPDAIGLRARALGYLGLTSIILGCLTLLVKRGHSHKSHHA